MSGVAGMPLPDEELEPCGTLAAYRRYLRRGDPVDRDCRQAVARDWQDRAASGYRRPPRPGSVHLDGGWKAACGRRRVAVTSDAGLVTCRTCLAVHCRHLEKAERLGGSRAA